MASPIPAASRPSHAPGARAGSRAATTALAGPVRWRMLLSAWLLLAMVLAQSVGFVHGTAHVHEHRSVHRTAGVITAETAGSVAAALEQLFDGHDDAAQCRLYDQVSRGDCAPTADIASALSMPVAAAPAQATFTWPCADCLPARARGPPAAG